MATPRLSKLLLDTLQAANESPSFDYAVLKALNSIAEYVDWPLGSVFIRNDQGKYESAGVSALRDKSLISFTEDPPVFSSGEGLIGVVAKSREPLIADIAKSSVMVRSRRKKALELGLRTTLAIPLLHDDEVLAVMEFFTRRKVRLGEKAMETFRLIGMQLGVALHRFLVMKKLQESEEMRRMVIQTAVDAIITLDETHRIVAFNRGAEGIFGYEAEEMLGHPLDRLLPERFKEVHRSHIHNFSKEKTQARLMSERSQIYGRRKNGEEFAAQASISKIETEKSILFTVILRDVSEQILLQEGLKEANRRITGILSRIVEEERQGAYPLHRMTHRDKGDVGGTEV